VAVGSWLTHTSPAGGPASAGASTTGTVASAMGSAIGPSPNWCHSVSVGSLNVTGLWRLQALNPGAMHWETITCIYLASGRTNKFSGILFRFPIDGFLETQKYTTIQTCARLVHASKYHPF
jgi:hypothetical protein